MTWLFSLSETLFWLSVVAIVYAYLGYVILLWVLSLLFSRPLNTRDSVPPVSLVIAAYNEEAVLESKLENALAMKYPPDRLEIAVISDGSTDGTNRIIQSWAKRDSRVRAWINPVNQGKDASLIQYVPRLAGDILLFSDANCFYPPELIQTIVRPFADPDIGFVTGSTTYLSSQEQEDQGGVGLYARLERLTKLLESRIGSCVGADGAVFAIRKDLFSLQSQNEINDLALPLRIVHQGYRGVLEPKADCYEEAATEPDQEFRRQVRITTGTLNTLLHCRGLMNPFRFPFFSFQVLSHKGMKMLSPLFLCLALVSSALMACSDVIGLILFVLIMAGVAIAFLPGTHSVKRGPLAVIRGTIHTFLLTNAAIALGWLGFLRRKSFASWNPERS